jgi:hypothetical protein
MHIGIYDYHDVYLPLIGPLMAIHVYASRKAQSTKLKPRRGSTSKTRVTGSISITWYKTWYMCVSRDMRTTSDTGMAKGTGRVVGVGSNIQRDNNGVCTSAGVVCDRRVRVEVSE